MCHVCVHVSFALVLSPFTDSYFALSKSLQIPSVGPMSNKEPRKEPTQPRRALKLFPKKTGGYNLPESAFEVCTNA